MPLYALLFGLFLIQEPVSSDAVLLEAYQYHYNVWIIHALFVLATVLDIVVGYAIGKWLHGRFSDNPLMQRLVRWTRPFSGSAGKYGEYVFFFLAGPFLFPLSALIAPWLDISFARTLVFLLLGDAIFWYAPEWLIVLGVKGTVTDPLAALFGVIVFSLLFAAVMRYFQQRT
jgi:membrane protein YqaA with SNARE-associated domain